MKIWKLTITSRRSRRREQQSDDVSFQLCDTKGRIEDGQFHKMMLSELELYVNHKVNFNPTDNIPPVSISKSDVNSL